MNHKDYTKLYDNQLFKGSSLEEALSNCSLEKLKRLDEGVSDLKSLGTYYQEAAKFIRKRIAILESELYKVLNSSENDSNPPPLPKPLEDS